VLSAMGWLHHRRQKSRMPCGLGTRVKGRSGMLAKHFGGAFEVGVSVERAPGVHVSPCLT
jgi:hypothetical protein